MGELALQATKDGTLVLTITNGVGQPAQVELAIETIEKLKGQIEASLVLARVRRAAIRQRQIEAGLLGGQSVAIG
jgi:hypothetical protein